MYIVLSVALSSDWCLDDCSEQRLVISNAKDWDEVYALRGECDAILVGAETLRRDNPSLRIKSELIRSERMARGKSPNLQRITMTRTGKLDPNLKFFSPDGDAIVFTESPANIEQSTRVICRKCLTARSVAAELEQMGCEKLMVEGGAQILRMFLSEGVFDELRVAQSPIVVGEESAPKLVEPWTMYATELNKCYHLDDMEVRWYKRTGSDGRKDYSLMSQAIEQSRLCKQDPTHYCVGAVIETRNGQIFTGYTGETDDHDHAEEAAIKKADAAGADLQGATIYSSMEPCSKRSSKARSCSELIIERGFARVVFALAEPLNFVRCVGESMLRSAGIEVVRIPELADCVEEINAYLNQ
ncbi:MAG: pyrimidine reductase [Rikenellaceae bacterium]|nr:pyrimidine reductase [Rikenellaceae bacterium]MBR2451594.1 dihydrofolate reductase family protein [Rikenellaceae bacterium]